MSKASINHESKANMKNNINLFICGGLLLAAALCTAVYQFWDEGRASDSVKTAVRQIEEQIMTPEPVFPEDEKELINFISYNTVPCEEEMPVLELDGNQYIGTLELASMGITLPVMSEWSYPKLKLSPCRFSGSIYQDDLIIAGHNYFSHFACLKDLDVGDEVFFTDAEGRVFSYVVSAQQLLDPMEAEALQAGDWDLTLFTCTIGGKYRVCVRCERASIPMPDASGIITSLRMDGCSTTV